MSLPKDFTSDPWFDTKGRMDDEEPATPEEVHALKNYLSKITSAPEAAKCIMAMDESRTPLTGKDLRVAWLIFETMMRFPDEQVVLLDLVDAIYALSDDELGLNSGVKDRYPQWPRWKSFDKFAELVDEMRRCRSLLRKFSLIRV